MQRNYQSALCHTPLAKETEVISAKDGKIILG
jgi:hypothetical protein